MSRPAHALVAAIVLAVTGGCGDDDEPTVNPTPLDVPETVALGVLPQPLTDSPTLPPPPPAPTTSVAATTTLAVTVPVSEPVAEHADGDRLLMIGDSLLASATPRNGGFMCSALTLFGWETEIDAQPTDDVDFLAEVLDQRFDPDGGDDWDVIGVMFGTQLDGADPEVATAYGEALDAVITGVAPRPVVLFTLPVVDIGRGELNDVVHARGEIHTNAIVVDFAERGGPVEEVVDSDGLVLSEDGNRRLSVITASVLGEAPGDDTGECLPTTYTG